MIALPLFKPTFEKGNSCFINPKSFESITDQWDYLKNIQKVSVDYLDELYKGLTPDVKTITPQPTNGKLNITLNNKVRLSRSGLTSSLINFLKEELNFANSEFFIKKKSGRNTFETARLLDGSPITVLNKTFAFGQVYGFEKAIIEAEKLNLKENNHYHELLGHLYGEINIDKAINHYRQAINMTKSKIEKQALIKEIERLNEKNDMSR